MTIKKNELTKMNNLLAHGATIADLANKFPKYDYWEIYWEVHDFSFLGKKRTITNRLKKIVSTKSQKKRQELAEEAQVLLNELYESLKTNSKKLIQIDRVLRK